MNGGGERGGGSSGSGFRSVSFSPLPCVGERAAIRNTQSTGLSEMSVLGLRIQFAIVFFSRLVSLVSCLSLLRLLCVASRDVFTQSCYCSSCISMGLWKMGRKWMSDCCRCGDRWWWCWWWWYFAHLMMSQNVSVFTCKRMFAIMMALMLSATLSKNTHGLKNQNCILLSYQNWKKRDNIRNERGSLPVSTVHI